MTNLFADTLKPVQIGDGLELLASRFDPQSALVFNGDDTLAGLSFDGERIWACWHDTKRQSVDSFDTSSGFDAALSAALEAARARLPRR